MWYDILNFINIVGVVTNACLIAFTSAWGMKHKLTEQLIIVLGFEVSQLSLLPKAGKLMRKTEVLSFKNVNS